MENRTKSAFHFLPLSDHTGDTFYTPLEVEASSFQCQREDTTSELASDRPLCSSQVEGDIKCSGTDCTVSVLVFTKLLLTFSVHNFQVVLF